MSGSGSSSSGVREVVDVYLGHIGVATGSASVGDAVANEGKRDALALNKRGQDQFNFRR